MQPLPPRELSPNHVEMLPSVERLPLTCLQTRAWIFEIWSRLKRAVAQRAGYRSSLRIFPTQASKKRIKLQRKYNGQEPSDILKGRIKLKMLGLGLDSKNIFLSPFIRAPVVSWLFHSSFPGEESAQLVNMMNEWTHTCVHNACQVNTHTHSQSTPIHTETLLTPTLLSRVLRPLSSPFLCLEVELLLVLWFPSFPLPVPLDKDVDDWLTVLFRLGCSAFGVRWSPDKEGEGTGSSFFSKDLFDLVGQIYIKLLFSYLGCILPLIFIHLFLFLKRCNVVPLINYFCIVQNRDSKWTKNESGSHF